MSKSKFPKRLWVRRLGREVLPFQVSEIKLQEDMVAYVREDAEPKKRPLRTPGR